MAEVKLERSLKLGDLEEGKIFDETELIIDFNGKRMVTIGYGGGLVYREGNRIRKFMYDVKTDPKGNVIEINNNGYSEICLGDKEYVKYQSKLKDTGIW